jgi:hypothetical protein
MPAAIQFVEFPSFIRTLFEQETIFLFLKRQHYTSPTINDPI